jgi:hypothetical protein
MRRELRMDRLAGLKAEIDRGMADVREGRLTEFDPRSVIALGRKLCAERAASGSKSDGKGDS